MPKYHPSLSQVVLERKRKRRNERLDNIFIAAGVFALFAAFSSVVLSIHEHTKVIKQKIAMESIQLVPTTPAWADFTINGSRHETVSYLQPDGVPYTVQINGQEWNLIHVDSFDDAKGHKPHVPFSGIQAQTYCDKHTIAYVDSEDKTELRVNLMHEIFHAGACFHGGDSWWNSVHPTEDYHPGVYHLGEFMASFIRDNPQFMEWEAQ